MRYFFYLLMAATVCGCLKDHSGLKRTPLGVQHAGIWRASRDNGDKPGFGFELQFTINGVNGTYWIMHPDHPGDFRKGRKVKMKTVKDDLKDFVFVVHFPGRDERTFVIHFDGPLSGERAMGMIEWTPTLTLPFEFKRVHL